MIEEQMKSNSLFQGEIIKKIIREQILKKQPNLAQIILLKKGIQYF